MRSNVPDRRFTSLIARFFLLLFLPFNLGHAGEANWTAGQPGENLNIALVTFGPGEEIWERFGHNALLVEDRNTGEARTYNYGIFDFGEADFLPNFLRGIMRYRMDVNDADRDLAVYMAEGRWIQRQDLNLSPAQRLKLDQFLQWNLRPENTHYRYEYFRSNCSTKVRDALNLALGNTLHLQTASPSRGFSYRMDALRLMRPEFWAMIGMDIGLGPLADQRLSFWDESFVPTELMRHLRELNVRDDAGQSVPLVARDVLLARAAIPDPPEFAPYWVWQFFAIGIAFSLLLIWLAKRRDRSWARYSLATLSSISVLILGLSGLLLIALWGFTEHQFAWRNENLLLFNPLCLLLLPSWLTSARARWLPSRFARYLTVLIVVLAAFAWFAKILPWFPQDNRQWIALLLPLHVALLLAQSHARNRRG